MTYGSQIEEFRVSDLKLERSETDRPSKPAVSGLNVTCFQSAETHNLRSQSVAICKAGEWFIPLTGFRMRKRKNGPLTGYASPSPVSHKATKKHAQCGGLPTAHTTPTEGLPQLPPLRPAASTQSPHRRAAPRQSQTHIDALRCESSSSMPSLSSFAEPNRSRIIHTRDSQCSGNFSLLRARIRYCLEFS